MGCFCSKDDSGSKHPHTSGSNHRPTHVRTERNGNQVQSASIFSDINRPPISFAGLDDSKKLQRLSDLSSHNKLHSNDIEFLNVSSITFIRYQSKQSTRHPPMRNTENGSCPLRNESWYFGKIDINRCMKVLGDRNVPDGTFIVRDSTSHSGTLCLSVKVRFPEGLAIFSIRVLETRNRFSEKQYRSTVDNKVFSCMHDVIKYYKVYGMKSKGISIKIGEGLGNKHFYIGEDNEEERSLQIKVEDVDLQEELGSGNFGTVWKGIWKKPDGSQLLVAVKKLKKTDDNELEKFIKEANVMKMVYHDNIVTFLGICYEENQHPKIVTELMSKGDLLKFLRENKKTPIGDLYYFAHQVASGMKFLASANIVHRDLAARNVLLGDQHIVKIADFGLSRVLKEDDIYTTLTENRLPIKWTAPEGLEPPRRFSVKSDVWSYSIFLTELITRGRAPYQRLSIREITKTRLVDQGYRMRKEDLGNDCPVSLYAFMEECWKSNPDERPGFETVLENIRRLYEPFVPLQQYS